MSANSRVSASIRGGLSLLFVLSQLFAVHVESLQDPDVPYTFFPFGEDEGDSSFRGDDIARQAAVTHVGFPYIYDSHGTAYVSISTVDF